jgi:hypothetical protein
MPPGRVSASRNREAAEAWAGPRGNPGLDHHRTLSPPVTLSPLIPNSSSVARSRLGLTFAFQGKIGHEIERGQYPNDLAVLNNRHMFNAMVDHAYGYVPDAPAW